MEFGIALMNYPGCWEDVAFAEQHGFSTAGFVDTPALAGDPYVCMALAAQHTSTIRLGTTLAVPGLRDPMVTAAALSTVNQIAPGRVFFATGTGYTGRLALGLKKQVSLAKLRNFARDVRDLVRGEEVAHRLGEGPERLVRLANREFVRNNQEHPIPVYIGADGPKAMHLAGEIGDGLLTVLRFASAWGGSADEFTRALETLKQGAAAAGRELDDPYSIWAPALSVLEPGESLISPRALAQAGPYAMLGFHAYACDQTLAEQWHPDLRSRLEVFEKEVLARIDMPRDKLFQQVHTGHLMHLLEGEASVLTEDIMRLTTLTGTADEIVSQIKVMESVGLKNLTLWVSPDHARDIIVDVAEKLMPQVA